MGGDLCQLLVHCLSVYGKNELPLPSGVTNCQVAPSKQPDTGEIRKMKICVSAAVTFRCSLL